MLGRAIRSQSPAITRSIDEHFGQAEHVVGFADFMGGARMGCVFLLRAALVGVYHFVGGVFGLSLFVNIDLIHFLDLRASLNLGGYPFP